MYLNIKFVNYIYINKIFFCIYEQIVEGQIYVIVVGVEGDYYIVVVSDSFQILFGQVLITLQNDVGQEIIIIVQSVDGIENAIYVIVDQDGIVQYIMQQFD